MPNDALSKIRRDAKAIQKRTGRSYQSALKEAGRNYRMRPHRKKVSGTKKKKRVGSHYVPVRAEHCKKVGSIGAVADASLAQTLAATRLKLKERLGWLMATKATARTKKEKRGLQVQISEVQKKLKALQ